MGFWAPLVSAISGLSTASKLSIASSVIGGAASYAAAKKQRKQAISDQDLQYVRMRNAAQLAGFNPLTVLRATGGQGFTGLPVISKAAAFGNMATGIFDAVRQSPIDKYNKEVRELDKQERKADLEIAPLQAKLMKKQIQDLGRQQQAYLYNDDGTPMKNAFGQHMYVDEQAAAVFPTLQGYITPNGRTLSLPHEQLLDMSVTSLPTATTAIGGGIVAAETKGAPTIFRYPHENMQGGRFTYGTLSNGQFVTPFVN
jgi:hypothetical protein